MLNRNVVIGWAALRRRNDEAIGVNTQGLAIPIFAILIFNTDPIIVKQMVDLSLDPCVVGVAENLDRVTNTQVPWAAGVSPGTGYAVLDPLARKARAA